MRFKQPQYGPSRINWSNPLTRDLLYASNTATNPVITGGKIVTPEGIGTGNNTPIYDSGKTLPNGTNYPKGLTILTIGFLNGTADNGATAFGIRVHPNNNVNNTQFAVYLPPFASRANVGVLIGYSDFSANAQVELAHGLPLTGSRIALAGTYVPNDAAGLKLYVNGALKGSTATSAVQPFNNGTNIMLNSADGGNLVTGFPTVANFIWTRALTPDEIRSISDNPWQLFEPLATRLFAGPLPSSNGWPIGGNVALGTLLYPTGPVTHATSGALVGSASTITGAAARVAAVVTHATTGALVGSASVITGAAVHNALHTTTGALAGAGATATGSATHFRAFTATGALVGAVSTIAGSAARGVTVVTHATSGALVGSASTLTGAATRFREFAATGALTGGASTVTGAATRFRVFSTSGALAGSGSTIAGVATRFRAFGSSGALSGGGAVITGAATRYRAMSSTGALVGQGGLIVGSAFVSHVHATSGALSAGGATVTGDASRSLGPTTHNTSGILFTAGAVLSALANRTRVHDTTGAASGGGATVTGSANHAVPHDTSGALTGGAGVIAGAAARTRVHDASGALAGSASSITGAVRRDRLHDSTGELANGGATVAGVAARLTVNVTHNTSGALSGAGARVTGSALRGTGYTALQLVQKILTNKQTLDPVTGKFTLYDDDNVTILYQSSAWEDVNGTIPYSGKALARIDKLT